jgi:hypothetical protein
MPASIDGYWAWLSYATKAALACGLFAWALRLCTRGWTDDWDLRLWPVTDAIAIALASPGDDGALSLAGCALVVVVARNVALVPRPAPRWRPPPWQRAAVIAGIAIVAVAALAYRPFHPLSAAFQGRDSDTSFGFGTGGDPARASTELAFTIGNEGLAAVTVRSIHAFDEAPADVDVMTHRTDVTTARSLAGLHRPVGMERIAPGDQLQAWLKLSNASCRGPDRVRRDEVRELVVRYETLGLIRTQRLPIDPPALLRCPGRH